MAIIAIAQEIPVVDAIVDSVVAIVGLAIGGGIDIAAVYELCDNVIQLVDAHVHKCSEISLTFLRSERIKYDKKEERAENKLFFFEKFSLSKPIYYFF